jgi:hypothetical protein
MADQKEKEPYVSQADRPEVKIDPEKPVSELRVRDLQAILGTSAIKKLEKFEHKELKLEKYEKHEKFEKFEKHEKFEKYEKLEIKELKLEKLEHDPIVKQFEPGPGPTQIDPEILAGLNQIIQTVGGLTKRVDELSNQVAELQKKVK